MNRILAIAYCLPSYLPINQMDRGDLTQQAGIISSLRSRGHYLTICYPRDLSSIETVAHDGARKVAPRTWSASKSFEFLGRVAWRVQRLLGVPYLNVFANLRFFDAYKSLLSKADIVFERHGIYRTAVARACRRLGKPHVLFFDADPLFEQEYAGQPVKGLLCWRARQTIRYNLKAADRVICVCDAARDRLIKVWGVLPERIVTMPNGVDITHHRPLPELRQSVRESYGLRFEPVVIFIGAFFPWHDVEGLIRSFSIVLRSCPTARLLMVGDGEGRPFAEALVSELGLDRSVTFLGRIPHQRVPELLSAADVAVAPYARMQTEFWGSPMKIFEYMACGAAIVASSAGQVAQVIRDRNNGLLVQPGDTESMAAAILELLRNNDLRARLGARAREDACAKHSWATYGEHLEAVFEQVLDQRAGRRARGR